MSLENALSSPAPVDPSAYLCEIACANARSGTGILITINGYVLTAWHVIEDHVANGEGRLYLPDGTPTQLTPEYFAWRNKDIAIIKASIDGPDLPTPIKMREPLVGEEAIVYGRPRGKLYANLGTVLQSKPERVHLSAHSIHGTSGGAYVGEDHTLLGVHTHRTKTQDGYLALGTHPAHVRTLIQYAARNTRP